jgi:hypothetical protein
MRPTRVGALLCLIVSCTSHPGLDVALRESSSVNSKLKT